MAVKVCNFINNLISIDKFTLCTTLRPQNQSLNILYFFPYILQFIDHHLKILFFPFKLKLTPLVYYVFALNIDLLSSQGASKETIIITKYQT